MTEIVTPVNMGNRPHRDNGEGVAPGPLLLYAPVPPREAAGFMKLHQYLCCLVCSKNSSDSSGK